MKVLLINGSPRQHGCTDAALSLVAESLHEAGIETDVFWMGNRPVGGCLACRKCAETGRCVQQDRVNEFLDLAGEYDGFVVGSPVHFASAAGSLTAFLDRVFYAGRNQRQSFAFKPGAAVVSARRAGTTATLDQLNKYFLYMEMPLIGSRYWNMVHGMTPEEVLQDTEGVQIMRTLGRNMAWFLKCKEAAEAAGISTPEQEPWTPTNFIR